MGSLTQPHCTAQTLTLTNAKVIEITYDTEITFYYMQLKKNKMKETSSKMGFLKNSSLCDWLEHGGGD